MMRIIVVLILVTYCSGTNTPTLWGSRVVAKASGPSDTMKYQFNGGVEASVIHGSELSRISIEAGKCVDSENRTWGSPCRVTGNDVYITMADVKAQDILLLSDAQLTRGMASTTFFVPHCKFPKPAKDGVDLNTSFPFSRFVKDMDSFNVDFAVQGAESTSNVTFSINGDDHCSWSGTQLQMNRSSFCVNLVKDVKADLRVFHGVFPKKSGVSRESFIFDGEETIIAVSIDYTQSGISPEVAECNRSATTFSFTGIIISLLMVILLWK
uniref:TSES33 n=1 Tax=Taenia solium TaxID=6204 RepID=Q6EMI6_TAESO|nr:TSES33 [Taenia solium]CAX86983.1 TSES33 diagnostic antigen [Taenia solium]